MTRCFAVAALAVLLALPASAQKPADPSPLERGQDPDVAVSADGRTDLRTGAPAMLAGIDVAVRPDTPEAMAREFLAGSALDLRSAADDLALAHVRSGAAGHTVRFRQTVGGVPVWGPETVVHVSPQARVRYALNAVRPGLALDGPAEPTVSADDARAALLAHLGAASPGGTDEASLVVWPGDDGARLAWSVRAEPAGVPGSWEGIVDARTGALVRVANRAVYHGGDPQGPSPERGPEPRTALPRVEFSPLFRADGTAFIFDPDPLTRAAGVAYGTAGYVDGNDANTPQLQAARTAVTLRDLAFDGTNYTLTGPWAEYVDFEAPFYGLFARPTANFEATRDENVFEAATTYWHIDNYLRYINETLGIPVRPTLYTTGARFDSHGLSGSDNSYYLGGSQRLSFGEGGVDDNEDADVVIHELGHGIHDWLTNRGLSNAEGLSEGFGDYVAASYTRHLGLLQPAQASYNWVFKWDGHNPFWGGRTVARGGTYPQGSVPHDRGQHWATSLMRVWNVLGREKTDRATFEGISRTNSSATQPQTAQAVLQAAADLGYTLAEVTAFFDSFRTQGYTVTMPTIVAEEDAPTAAGRVLALTPAGPNPFTGATMFEILAAQSGDVRVEAFDALGRAVAVLFEGEVVAGRRAPVALDGAALRPGVYVVRARGLGAEAVQRVTLTR